MKKTLLALIIILAVASMSMGTTFAGFCDTEMVTDNYFTTGTLDLKVAKCPNSCEPDDLVFCDDLPYGTGLLLKETAPDVFEKVLCFQAEEDGAFKTSYTCNLKLWNAGTTDGRASVHIRGVTAKSEVGNEEALLTNTNVTLWYDLDKDGNSTINDGKPNETTDETEVVTGTLGSLDCQPVPRDPVWLLPANQLRNLQIVIKPQDGAPGDSLTFHIQFNLVGFYFTKGGDIVPVGFCDTEICLENCLKVKK